MILWCLKSAFSVIHSRHVELDLFWSEFWFICVLFLLLFYLCVDLFICPLVLVDCLLLLFQCNIQVGTANLFMWTFLCLHYVKPYFFIPPSLALYHTAPGCLNVCWTSDFIASYNASVNSTLVFLFCFGFSHKASTLYTG